MEEKKGCGCGKSSPQNEKELKRKQLLNKMSKTNKIYKTKTNIFM